MLGKKRICHSYSLVMSSLTYDSILVFAAHGSERPNLYRMSTSPLSFLVVGVGQDFTCKWIGFRCEIRLITTACEQLDSCLQAFPATVQIVPKTARSARSCSKITQ